MENIQENNKIIAEFMGAKVTDVKGLQKPIYYPIMGKSVYVDKLKYHSSWDWLIPVVKKCLIGEAETNRPDLVSNIYESLVNLEIDLVYKDIIEFIKWYNQQNKS